jgi:DoxX-like family
MYTVAVPEGPSVHITYLILTGVLAVIFAGSGMAKVFNTSFARTNAAHLGISTAQSRAIGAVEMVALGGLLAGVSFKPLSVVTAIGIVALMIGAIGYLLPREGGAVKLLPAVVTGTTALALVSFAV